MTKFGRAISFQCNHLNLIEHCQAQGQSLYILVQMLLWHGPAVVINGQTEGTNTSEISYALPEIDFEIMKSKAC